MGDILLMMSSRLGELWAEVSDQHPQKVKKKLCMTECAFSSYING
jgi:hypothetical protein